ncbi:glycosyltransferase family 2 protein [Pseudoduganella umbonata]|uniref:Glycosyltransferase family 2 protein n=1 Tax=Pseudoduganella umbonata TaxID=864828 RepID=A0A4P8HWF4_9BURK|nr:glycosyltransferase family 2 protein [Pseudoduganella umbonata]MBB3223852.1 glycosyltransferase involved in cell wall biosynthesis [Pseudoduganella umbonata]QCP12735.1 glycosyltransferase family 2 protein [Pseudoduganella umbonata]
MLSLIVPVYGNEGSLPELLAAVTRLNDSVGGDFETVFVVDASPDNCYVLLRKQLPQQRFRSQLVLLSRNFGSFAAIRMGLQFAKGNRFAVMAADLQEPPELVLRMNDILQRDEADVVVGVREGRSDPLASRLMSGAFWWLYRKYVMPDVPPGGVDMFGCNRDFRDTLLTLEERHSSLIGQLFWVGYRRSVVPYTRLERQHGKSGWTFRKKWKYLMDSAFSFTDLPIKLLIRVGAAGTALVTALAVVVVVARLNGLIAVPGYAMTILTMALLGSINLFGLGIVGVYAWRTYENTKQRPNAIYRQSHVFEGAHVHAHQR